MCFYIYLCNIVDQTSLFHFVTQILTIICRRTDLRSKNYQSKSTVKYKTETKHRCKHKQTLCSYKTLYGKSTSMHFQSDFCNLMFLYNYTNVFQSFFSYQKKSIMYYFLQCSASPYIFMYYFVFHWQTYIYFNLSTNFKRYTKAENFFC